MVGAGLLGLCTAWHLRRRGREILVLEAAEVGHAGSGSKGLCRIFRLGYDDARYVTMATLALPLWRELEEETGSSLLTTTGQLTFGPDLDALSAGLEGAGAPWERWAVDEVVRRYPAVAAPGPAVFEPQSGVIHAESALIALKQSVRDALHEGVDVVRLTNEGGRVRLETPLGAVDTPRMICCAGPRTAPLLMGAGLDLDVHPSLEQVAYFAARDSIPTDLPVLVERGRPMFYGLPVPGKSWFKAGRHQSKPRIALDDANLQPGEAEDALLASDVARFLPGFDPRPVCSERCFYDNSPDEDFVIDRIGSITVGAGTSGHGFKFGPLLGEMLADLAEETQPRLPVDWLAARRFGSR